MTSWKCLFDINQRTKESFAKSGNDKLWKQATHSVEEKASVDPTKAPELVHQGKISGIPKIYGHPGVLGLVVPRLGQVAATSASPKRAAEIAKLDEGIAQLQREVGEFGRAAEKFPSSINEFFKRVRKSINKSEQEVRARLMDWGIKPPTIAPSPAIAPAPKIGLPGQFQKQQIEGKVGEASIPVHLEDHEQRAKDAYNAYKQQPHCHFCRITLGNIKNPYIHDDRVSSTWGFVDGVAACGNCHKKYERAQTSRLYTVEEKAPKQHFQSEEELSDWTTKSWQVIVDINKSVGDLLFLCRLHKSGEVCSMYHEGEKPLATHIAKHPRYPFSSGKYICKDHAKQMEEEGREVYPIPEYKELLKEFGSPGPADYRPFKPGTIG